MQNVKANENLGETQSKYMESDSGQYCRICFCGVDYSCHGVAPSLAVGWESFVVEWGL